MKLHLIERMINTTLLINGLEPVGYITSSGFDNIKEYGYTHLNEERSEKINIPLYKLD